MTRANHLAVVRLRSSTKARPDLHGTPAWDGLAGDGDVIPVVARVIDDEDRDASGAGWGYPGILQWWQPFFCYRRGGDDGVGDVLDVEGVCYCCAASSSRIVWRLGCCGQPHQNLAVLVALRR